MVTSREAFKRTVNERFSAFSKALDDTVRAFASDRKELRFTAAQELASAGCDLEDILSASDRPHWLSPIRDSAGLFAARKTENAAAALLETLSKLRAKVKNIEFDDRDVRPYDFDELFGKRRAESKLPELFEELIDAIKAIICSGEVDSFTVLEALKDVANMLQANAKGSYVAVNQSVWLSRYVRHFVIATLKKIPVIEQLVEAYEKTQDEVEKAFESLNQKLQADAVKQISEKLPKLRQLPESPGSTGLSLPAPGGTAGDSDSEN